MSQDRQFYSIQSFYLCRWNASVTKTCVTLEWASRCRSWVLYPLLPILYSCNSYYQNKECQRLNMKYFCICEIVSPSLLWYFLGQAKKILIEIKINPFVCKSIHRYYFMIRLWIGITKMYKMRKSSLVETLYSLPVWTKKSVFFIHENKAL